MEDLNLFAFCISQAQITNLQSTVYTRNCTPKYHGMPAIIQAIVKLDSLPRSLDSVINYGRCLHPWDILKNDSISISLWDHYPVRGQILSRSRFLGSTCNQGQQEVDPPYHVVHTNQIAPLHLASRSLPRKQLHAGLKPCCRVSLGNIFSMQFDPYLCRHHGIVRTQRHFGEAGSGLTIREQLGKYMVDWSCEHVRHTYRQM